MEQALARFRKYLNRRFGHSSTPKHYLSDLRIFISVVGDKAPEDITPADIDLFVDEQIAGGLSPTTANRRLAGVRLSEMLALGLDDLDLAAERAIVRGSKPGHDRVVFLTPTLIAALHRYLEKRPELADEGRVFVLHGRSPSPRTVQRRLREYGEEAGVEVSPHKIRHTLATRLLNQGMPIHSLQKLLGHEHLNNTQIYARLYDQTLYRQFREATARLESVAVDDWPETIAAAPVPAEMEVA